MVTEEDIKRLARRIWEAEGCPSGKYVNHYFRAKKMLEHRERVQSEINNYRGAWESEFNCLSHSRMPHSKTYRIKTKHG